MVNSQRLLDGFRVLLSSFGTGRLSRVASTRAEIPAKFEPPREKLGYRDLVGGIEYSGCRPAGLERLAGKLKCRKAREIGLLEGQIGDARQVEARSWAIDALRPGKAVGDRNPHVGGSELSYQRAIAEFDQAVHNRLRMDQHVDLRRTEAKKDGAPR